MKLKWVDVLEIAISLSEAHEDIDPRYINFVNLRRLVTELPEFDDDPERSGEKILEAIQAAWIEEAE
ncbi:MAG: Fe-S cluster assembly protein IscX [Pseudomonas sp.]|jgi:FeS assembly protein IscX|nr:Fe-S cluster assembly protein IscX [Pseudomonas sp.]MDD2222322.1 Fe-S cluster assembly protein IscX [Pseudomonas sp.]MDY0413950.1 Fe-S cluster assembly protein IscX [Pseudomonas sp.]NLO53472.1 Fe-S cluster assembly protein IscX [Gammaproteobacteria bacterium]